MTGNDRKQLTGKLKEFIAKKDIDLFGITNKITDEIVHKKRDIDGKSIIIIGIYMIDESLDLWLEPPNWKAGKCFSDEILRAYCFEIALFLERLGWKTQPIPYNGAYLKEIGHYAGIGKIGKNNVLVTPEFGPNIRLRAIVTDAELEPTPESDFDPCLECELPCIKKCPAMAFDKQKQVTPRPNSYALEPCLTYQKQNLKEVSQFSALWCQECIQHCKYYQGYQESTI